MELIFLVVPVAFYFYFKALKKDKDKLTVENAWIPLPKGLEFITNGYYIYFFKPIGKSELHAFASPHMYEETPEVYIGEVPKYFAGLLLKAIEKGGANYCRANEVTSKGRLLINYSHSPGNSKNFWGFIEENGFEDIEKDFEKDFNVSVKVGHNGKEVYVTGILPNAIERAEQEKQMQNWCNRLQLWWEKKKKGEASEEFEGLLEKNLNATHVYMYKTITGDRTIFEKEGRALRMPNSFKSDILPH